MLPILMQKKMGGTAVGENGAAQQTGNGDAVQVEKDGGPHVVGRCVGDPRGQVRQHGGAQQDDPVAALRCLLSSGGRPGARVAHLRRELETNVGNLPWTLPSVDCSSALMVGRCQADHSRKTHRSGAARGCRWLGDWAPEAGRVRGSGRSHGPLPDRCKEGEAGSYGCASQPQMPVRVPASRGRGAAEPASGIRPPKVPMSWR